VSKRRISGLIKLTKLFIFKTSLLSDAATRLPNVGRPEGTTGRYTLPNVYEDQTKILCWAKNSVAAQKSPCVSYIYAQGNCCNLLHFQTWHIYQTLPCTYLNYCSTIKIIVSTLLMLLLKCYFFKTLTYITETCILSFLLPLYNTFNDHI